jgi:hypothetical protein
MTKIELKTSSAPNHSSGKPELSGLTLKTFKKHYGVRTRSLVMDRNNHKAFEIRATWLQFVLDYKYVHLHYRLLQFLEFFLWG